MFRLTINRFARCAFTLVELPVVGTRKRAAFTLVELLVVIGIISVLMAMLMPALMRVREQSFRTVCASNMRQWGIGLAAYRSENGGSFPDCDGPHLSWVGLNFQQQFTHRYLTSENKFGAAGTAATNPMHVQYCPTQDGYREIMLGGWTAPPPLELIGYFYLPGRPPAAQQGYFEPMMYTHEEWATRKRFGGKYANAPVMMDIAEHMKPALGGWFGIDTGPRSAHPNKQTGIPAGMNFMFEDGHVTWMHFSAVGIGGTVSTSECYFDIPVNQ